MSPLDARIAELLVARGIVSPQGIEALRARAASRPAARSGSALLEVAVELQLLAPAVATAFLTTARADLVDRTSWEGARGSQVRPALGAPAPPRSSQPRDGVDGTSWEGARGSQVRLALGAPAPPRSSPDDVDRTSWEGGPAAAAAPALAGSDRTRWEASLPGSARPQPSPPAADITRWEGPGAPPAAGPLAVLRDREEVWGTRWESPVDDDHTMQLGDTPQGSRASGTFRDRLEMPSALPTATEPPEVRYEVLEEDEPGRRSGPYPPVAEARRAACFAVRVLDKRLQRQLVLCVARRGEERGLTRHAKILAQLDHPSIPRVHDALRWNGAPAFITDALEGETFGAHGHDEPLGEAAQLRAFLDVAAAVAHAHERGLVHGTLGPSRVVLGTYGRAWVTGWESARALPGAPASALRATADVGAAASPGDAPRAPEVLDGEEPTPASDVWGLGRVLERVLIAAGRGAAPELKALVRKACARSADARYDTAADLAEDVRRYLDGRSVGALRETPLRALRRVAKHHPVAASVAVIALVIALGSGVATLAVTRKQLAKASTQASEAAAQREAARRLLADANEANGRTQARQRVAEQRLALERALRSPATGGDDPDAARTAQLDRAGELLAAMEQAASTSGADHDVTFVAARLRRARAEHHLRGAARPDPARALVEYGALADLLQRRVERAARGDGGPFDEGVLAGAQLAEAQLGRFLSARRLPGKGARAEEESALDAMATLEDTRELARLERAVRKLEAEAARLVALRPPETPPEDEALLDAVDAIARARPDLSYAHELRGRLRVALSFPGIHRGAQVRLPDGRQGEAEARSHYYGAFDAFFRASYLDPSETEPRVSYLEVWNAKYALHYPWRWIGGFAIDNALRAARLSPRPEATLRVVRHLGLLDRSVAGAALLERWRRSPELEPSVRAAVELARARALLAGGARIAPDEVEAIDAPPELRADRQVLLGWSLLVGGDVRRGFEQAMACLQQPPGPTLGLRDLTDALCDPRVDPRELREVLLRALPPPEAGAEENPVVHALLLARATVRARLGDPGFRDDLSRLERIDHSVRMPTRAHARATLAGAIGHAKLDPMHPGSHVQALLVWAQVNIDVGSTEREVIGARDLIVERLRRNGAAPAADQLSAFDPIDELYVRRAWVPAEAHAWQLPEAGR